MAKRTEDTTFTFITSPRVRGDQLMREVQHEGRVRAAQAGGKMLSAQPAGAMDLSATERQQIVMITVEFED